MSTALYRRYRPEAFDDVIGQEHVTEPLRQALRTNRVNHAYLFSGPRGCGKTTSARILARVLNCARREPDSDGVWPDAPCGECDSCRELSRGGSGSLDVVEIDAASHGGVDDARELRERATFSPARDRYKVFVIDEAHMVSPAGFNALLKIVEEPPEHVRFIFATTEPEKVLPTIRSRTHHYPFHLVSSEQRLAYLRSLCEHEGVPVGKGVLELVVRAGEGSVRDSLSVLDQLIAGADEEGLDYERAVALLGYTHAALLDGVVDALAAGDGASVFRVVDHVIESGHDPRRFVEDLLERLRDLVIIRAVGEAASAVLRGLPEDRLARMAGQAERFGAAELSRAADVTNAALTEMTGATSPRLHLELLCARLLLPGADVSERGLTARMDRLERRFGLGGGYEPFPRPDARGPGMQAGLPAPSTPEGGAAQGGPAEAGLAQPAPGQASPAPAPARDVLVPGGGSPTDPPPSPPSATDGMNGRERGRERSAASQAPTATPTEPTTGGELEAVRRMWPDVLERLKTLKRTTWTTTSHAHVLDVSGGVLRLGFTNSGALGMFTRGAHAEFVRQALIDVLGVDVRVEAVKAALAGTGDPAPQPATSPGQGAPARADRTGTATSPDMPPAGAPPEGRAGPGRPGNAETREDGSARQPGDAEPGLAPTREAPPPRPGPGPSGQSREPRRPRAKEEQEPGPHRAGVAPPVGHDVDPEHDVPEMDDPDAEDSSLVGAAVVEQLLGGRIIHVED